MTAREGDQKFPKRRVTYVLYGQPLDRKSGVSDTGSVDLKSDTVSYQTNAPLSRRRSDMAVADLFIRHAPPNVVGSNRLGELVGTNVFYAVSKVEFEWLYNNIKHTAACTVLDLSGGGGGGLTPCPHTTNRLLGLLKCPRVTFLGPDPTRRNVDPTRPDPRLPTKSLTRPDPRRDLSPICIVFN